MGQQFEDFSLAAQDVSEATHGVVTPSNAISAIGFVLSMHGINSLDTWPGIIETGTGFVLDVVDGKVARATNTSSPIGEAVDATLDKIKTGYFAARLLLEARAPKGLVGAVIAQNVLNAAITMYDKRVNSEPQVHPVKEGKWGMFAQNSGLGLHAIGSKLKETNPSAGRAVKAAGSIIGYTGVALSLVASAKYVKAARKVNVGETIFTPDAETFIALFEDAEELRKLASESRFADFRIPPDDDVTVIDELHLADKVTAHYKEFDQISADQLSPQQNTLREHRRKGYGEFIGRKIAVTALQNCKPFLRVAWNNANEIKAGRSDGNYEPIVGTLVTPPPNAQPHAFYLHSDHIPRSSHLSPLFKRTGLLEVWPVVPEADQLKRQVEVEFKD